MHIFKQPGEGNRHVWARLAAEWTGQQEDGAGQSKGRASPITVMEGREGHRNPLLRKGEQPQGRVSRAEPQGLFHVAVT